MKWFLTWFVLIPFALITALTIALPVAVVGLVVWGVIVLAKRQAGK